MDHRLLLALPLLSLAAPVGQDPAGADPDGPLAPPKGLEKVQLVIPEDNPLTVEKAELGKMLFFDTRLSKDGSMSCQTCHVHEKAWSDGIALSTKVDGSKNTRNSPSLYNVGYQPYYYWDGRAPTMEANVLAAWKGHMGGDPDATAKVLADIPAYAAAFEKAFGAEPTGTNIVQALTSFVRTLRSGGSAYDEGTMSEAAKRGERLFAERCMSCHVPPLFTDFQFHNVGVGDPSDKGRLAQEPDNPARTRAFKTPGLRGAARSAPYFHDGSVATLREAVAIMARGGIDNEFLDPILKTQREKLRPLTDEEIDDLVAFIEALDSNESFTPPKLP
ncbi:MAG TPA: cytochrome c peroxidase [Planctomycetota bacterium]|nr:cytochrome c peroxidase [Planctomycetota bacterium]